MTTIVGWTPVVAVPRLLPGWAAQLGRYGLVGGLGTVLSAVSYLVFRTWWDAVPANLAAVVVSTVVSTEANRRFTFRGARADRVREYLQNAGTVAFYALYSSVVLVLLGVLIDDVTALEESTAVAAASVVGGAARFVVLRNWVFAPPGRRTGRGVRRRVRHSGVMILLPAAVRRVLVVGAAFGGLVLGTAASCDTGSTAQAPSTPAPSATPVPSAAPSASAATAVPTAARGGEPGDDRGGGNRGGSGRRGGSDDSGGDDRGGDG